MLMVSEYSENAWNMFLYENDYQFLDTLKTKDRKIKVDCNLLKKVKFHELEWSSSLTPRHWNQFADDAAVISRLESENQILLNLFSRWCSWVFGSLLGFPLCQTKLYFFLIFFGRFSAIPNETTFFSNSLYDNAIKDNSRSSSPEVFCGKGDLKLY